MRTRTDNIWPAGVAKPAQRALASAGYTKVEDLAQTNESALAKLHGMGPKAIMALRQALVELGLSFKED